MDHWACKLIDYSDFFYHISYNNLSQCFYSPLFLGYLSPMCGIFSRKGKWIWRDGSNLRPSLISVVRSVITLTLFNNCSAKCFLFSSKYSCQNSQEKISNQSLKGLFYNYLVLGKSLPRVALKAPRWNFLFQQMFQWYQSPIYSVIPKW